MKLLFILFKTLLVLILLLLIVLSVLLVTQGVESTPRIKPGKSLSHQDIVHIKQLLRKNDPRHLKSGDLRSLQLTERDLNLLLTYATRNTWNINTSIALHPGSAEIGLTFKLPKNPVGQYLNTSATLSQAAYSVIIKTLTIGDLDMPGWPFDHLRRYAHRALMQRFDEYRAIMEAINGYLLLEDRMVLMYQWHPELASQLQSRSKGLFFSEADQSRLLAYEQELARIAAQYAYRRISLSKALAPMFQLARERTEAGNDPKAENRALLLVLGMNVLGIDVRSFINAPADRRQRRVRLAVWGRYDLVQHFLVSAALTVSAGSGFADAMGLFKELDDSRGGSGFSFPDLLADHAGVRLAEMATASDQLARIMQQRMSDISKESDFMPRIDHLPEGMMELEFKQRYQDPDSASYRLVEEEIQRRIAQCRVYRSGQ
jgi:hypothetical protein